MFSAALSLSDLLITLSCLPCPFCFVCAARVCDNAMLRCQNGGTCHHHQRCHCSPGFTGILCERTRCQGPGDCDDQLSGQASLHHRPTGRHHTLTLVVFPLLFVSLCWGTWTKSSTKTWNAENEHSTLRTWRTKNVWTMCWADNISNSFFVYPRPQWWMAVLLAQMAVHWCVILNDRRIYERSGEITAVL